MSKLNKWLLFVVIFLAICAMLILPRLSYYPMAPGYGAGIDYGRQYIVDNGRIPDTSANGTWQGLLSNYGSQDTAAKVEFAIINILTGTVPLEDGIGFLNIVNFSKIILMPAFGLMAYSIFARRGEWSLTNAAIIVFFSMMPLASSLPSDTISVVSGNLITMALFIPIMMLIIRPLDLKRLLILSLMSVTFLLMWHTWCLYLIIFVAVFFFGSIVNGQKERYRTLLFLIVAYFVVGTLFNREQLIDVPLSALMTLLSGGSGPLDISFPSELVAYKTGATIYSVIQIIASVLIVLIIAFPAFSMLRRRIKGKLPEQEEALLLVAVGLVVSWISLFGFGGVSTLIGRALEPAIPIAIIFAAYLLSKKPTLHELAWPKDCPTIWGRNKISWAPVVLILLTLLCAVSYPYAPDTPSDIDGYEAASYRYVETHFGTNSSFYSDFRMVTPLIYYDMHNLYSIDRQSQNDSLYMGLLEVYYGFVDPANPIGRQLMGGQQHYVLTSHRQSIVGVADPNMYLIPAINGFEANFGHSQHYGHIYSSGNVDVWVYV